jgi:hypothetical protein
MESLIPIEVIEKKFLLIRGRKVLLDLKLRELVASNKDLARRLDELEKKYDGRFKIVFNRILKNSLLRSGDTWIAPREVCPVLKSGGSR